MEKSASKSLEKQVIDTKLAEPPKNNHGILIVALVIFVVLVVLLLGGYFVYRYYREQIESKKQQQTEQSAKEQAETGSLPAPEQTEFFRTEIPPNRLKTEGEIKAQLNGQ